MVKDGIWDNKSTTGLLTLLAQHVSNEALSSTPVTLDLCDPSMTVKKSVPIIMVKKFDNAKSKNTVWYSADFSDKDVTALETALQAQDFSGAAVGLDKEGGKVSLSKTVCGIRRTTRRRSNLWPPPLPRQ